MGRVHGLDDEPNFKNYLKTLLVKIGKDFNWCESCGVSTGGKSIIHHTKYDGATLYDLEVVCIGCNNLGANRGLK